MIVVKADVVIASIFARGISAVSFRDLKVICNDLNFRIDSLYFIHDSNTLSVIALARPDIFTYFDDGIRRGTWSRPEEYLRNVVKTMYLPEKSKLRITNCLVGLLDKELVGDFSQVFTQEYVDKNFTWRIPIEYREKFIEIIDKHVERLTTVTE